MEKIKTRASKKPGVVMCLLDPSKKQNIKKQKFGFDIHGVLDDLPATFVALNNALYDHGHEIHIITGSFPSTEIFEQLQSLGVKWHRFFSISEYHRKIGSKLKIKEDGPWLNDKLWNMTKGEYCKREGINLHFDDSQEYEPYFSTPFAKVWTKNNRNGRGPKKKKSHFKK